MGRRSCCCAAPRPIVYRITLKSDILMWVKVGDHRTWFFAQQLLHAVVSLLPYCVPDEVLLLLRQAS